MQVILRNINLLTKKKDDLNHYWRMKMSSHICVHGSFSFVDLNCILIYLIFLTENAVALWTSSGERRGVKYFQSKHCSKFSSMIHQLHLKEEKALFLYLYWTWRQCLLSEILGLVQGCGLQIVRTCLGGIFFCLCKDFCWTCFSEIVKFVWF